MINRCYLVLAALPAIIGLGVPLSGAHAAPLHPAPTLPVAASRSHSGQQPPEAQHRAQTLGWIPTHSHAQVAYIPTRISGVAPTWVRGRRHAIKRHASRHHVVRPHVAPPHTASRKVHGHPSAVIASKGRKPMESTHLPVIITSKDRGKTFTVAPGQEVALELQQDLGWHVDEPDPKVLKALTPLNGTAKFRAEQPGTAEIKGYGRMIPKPGQVAAMFVIEFEATVRVEAASAPR